MGLPSPFVVVTEFKPVETGSVAVEAILNDLKGFWRGMNFECWRMCLDIRPAVQ